jgi:hypothetical protein
MLVLGMAFAACWGVLQLAVLGWPARSVRVGTLLLAVGAGIYGCGVLAVALQLGYTRFLSAITGQPLSDVVRTASYTVDPFLEEIVKVVPLLLLAWPVRARLQRGLTDHLLLGAAVGAGFQLFEALLRFGSRGGSAVSVPGGWLLPVSLSAPVVPRPDAALTSWLPAPVGSAGLLGSGTSINQHLAWSAVAGFGVGLLVRRRGRVRLLAPLLVLLVGADHAAYNYDALRGGAGGPGHLLAAPFVASQPLTGLWPFLALVAAVVLDRRLLSRLQAQAGQLRLRRESGGAEGAAALARYATQGMPWTLLVVPRFVQVRRAALYAREREPTAGEPLLRAVGAMRDQLDAADSPSAWRGVGRAVLAGATGEQATGQWLRRFWPLLLWLVLLLPAFLYFVVGSTPVASGLQKALAQTALFVPLLVLPAVAGLALLAWQLAVGVRGLPAALGAPSGDVVARLQLRILTALGAATFGAVVLASWLRGGRPQSRVVSNVHVLDALSSLLLVAGVALLIAAFVFFPPSFALVAVATEAGMILVPTAALSGAFVTTAGLGLAGLLLSQAAEQGSGQRSGGSGSSGGSGPRAPDPALPDLPPRPPAPKPQVNHWKLRNIVDQLWKGTKNPNRVGDGTTMDAVRNELRTGRPTGGLFHSGKAREAVNALNNWLQRYGPQVSREDRLWARRLLSELEKALRGQ